MRSSTWHVIIIAGVASIFFFSFLGAVHLFDWDEINFAESAREMIVTGNYSRVQIDFAPFWEKPPFFFFFFFLSMKLLGVNEFAARFPNALCGVVTLISIYLIGRSYKDKSFALFWVLMHVGALLPYLYFKSGIIDPVFNYFIFLGIYFLTRVVGTTTAHAKDVKRFSMLGGVAIGLAIITKGPVGLLIPLLTFLLYWAWQKFRNMIATQALFISFFAVLSIPLLWFGYETYQNGFWFINAFIKYQIALFSEPVAGHEQPFYYHFAIVLLGCFPASISPSLGKSFLLLYFGKLFPAETLTSPRGSLGSSGKATFPLAR